MRPEAHADTIVAIATAPGRGGVGVVRVSGPAAGTIAAAILDKVVRAPREAIHSQFLDATGKPIDEGIALFFAGPRSYTGEDVLELQGHGGPIVLEMLLARTLELGARRAQPGEFTQRAFLNDKLDLAQAEAVADLIDAGSTAAAKAAVRSLQGDFSAQVRELVEALIELRVWVEAAIDFPEEEIDFLADQTLIRKLEALRQRFKDILRSAQRGRLLRDGMTVVIAGRPNAGKSSLLNALAGYEAAIVTPLAGTTRDVLREHIAIDGMPLHIVDTAGLRAQGESATDIVEIEGMRRARAEMIHADRVLFVVDSLDDAAAKSWADERNNLPPSVPVTVLFNKIDSLEGDDSVARSLAARPLPGADRILCISAATGSGLDVLREHLKQCMGFDSGESSAFSARTRHLEALTRAELHADAAMRQLAESRAGELVAEELRSAQRALAEITGEFHAEDLLGRIFGSFCIGK